MVLNPKIFFGSTGLLVLAMFGGRLSGFARELLIAASFGVSADADVAVVILTLPDLFVNILLSGGLSVALVPAFQKVRPELKMLLLAQSSSVVLIPFGILSILLISFPTAFFKLVAPGMANADIKLTLVSLLLLGISLPLAALSGVSSAALNSNGKFFVAGCGTLLFNICVIFSIVFGFGDKQQFGLTLLCFGVGFGASLRLLSQYMTLFLSEKAPLSKIFDCWLVDQKLINSFLAGMGATSVLVLVPVVIRAASSILGEGQLAAFNYAMKLVDLPVGVFIASIVTVMYSRISKAIQSNMLLEADSILEMGMFKVLVFSVSVVLCGWHFSDAAVNLLFGFGRVTEAERLHVVSLVKIALLSVPWIGVVSVMTAAVNANGKHSLVLRLSFYGFLFLPLMLLPGVIERSPLLLLASQPFFYMLLSYFFYKQSVVKLKLNFVNSYLKPLLLMVLAFIPFVFFDIVCSEMFTDHSSLYDVSRIVLAILSWCAMVHTGFKVGGGQPIPMK